MNNIKDFLDRAAAAYYAGQPIISDEQFDRLAELHDYQFVGSRSSGKTAKHLYQMYSLQKHYEDEGLPSPLAGYKNVANSLKLDGAAISLLYVNGELVRALTRGDGIEGQDITKNILASNHLVPKTIAVDGIYQVTGEVAAPKHIENARNYAAGALNLKDPEEFKTRALTFFAYGVQPNLFPTFSQDMAKLAELGFNVINEPGLDAIYPCDGMVFRIDDNHTFNQLGYTAKHPRGAYALKERAAWVETKILDVEWQVGKSGKVTPVAILEPVMIGDALVSRATLNNPGFIESLGIQLGDTVAVARAGEIIPCILHKVDA